MTHRIAAFARARQRLQGFSFRGHARERSDTKISDLVSPPLSVRCPHLQSRDRHDDFRRRTPVYLTGPASALSLQSVARFALERMKGFLVLLIARIASSPLPRCRYRISSPACIPLRELCYQVITRSVTHTPQSVLLPPPRLDGHAGSRRDAGSIPGWCWGIRVSLLVEQPSPAVMRCTAPCK